MDGYDINEGKKVSNDENLITEGLKYMYYFLVGISFVIPVLLMLNLLYINVVGANGQIVERTQYFIWTSPLLLGKIFRETADGAFFTLAALIPLILLFIGLFYFAVSIVKAFKEKISWKHAESCNQALTSIIIAIAATLLIFSIIDSFFNIRTGLSGQDLYFNIFIYIALALAILGKVVAYFYFIQVKNKHLF